jgi:hypothetical protein
VCRISNSVLLSKTRHNKYLWNEIGNVTEIWIFSPKKPFLPLKTLNGGLEYDSNVGVEIS